MIWLTEDICVKRTHISSIEWTGPGECSVGLLSGMVFKLQGDAASTVWSLLTEDAE